jgi:hypothetical protein
VDKINHDDTGATASWTHVHTLMVLLAVLFSADWYSVGDRYVLARDRRLVPLGSLTWNEADHLKGAALDGLTRSLTREQWARLDAGETLRYGDLSPDQQRMVEQYATGIRAREDSVALATQMSGRDTQIFIGTNEYVPTPRFIIQLVGPYGRGHFVQAELSDLAGIRP